MMRRKTANKMDKQLLEMQPLNPGDLCRIKRGGVYIHSHNIDIPANAYCIYFGEDRQLDFRTGLKRIVHKFLALGKEIHIHPTYVSLVVTDEGEDDREVQQL